LAAPRIAATILISYPRVEHEVFAGERSGHFRHGFNIGIDAMDASPRSSTKDLRDSGAGREKLFALCAPTHGTPRAQRL
jgi:hypothetical protein